MTTPRAAAAALLALLLAAARPAAAAPPPAPDPAPAPAPAAVALFESAEAAFDALRASPRLQRYRDSYAAVLERYQRVFDRHPRTRQAELSLLRAGQLHTLLFRWTGREADLNTAQHYYLRLIETYPQSTLVDDAQLAIGYLHLDLYQDPHQAYVEFAKVAARAPKGDMLAEAARKLRELAAYAPREPAAAQPAAGSGDIACPPPPAPASSAPAPPSSATAPTPPPALKPLAGSAPLPPEPGRGAEPAAVAAKLPPARVRNIRHWSNPQYTRVVIDLDRATNFYSNLLQDAADAARPPRLYLDLFGSVVEERFCRPVPVNDGILLTIRAGQHAPETVRVVLDIDRLRTWRIFAMEDPFRVIVDVTGGEEPAPPAAEESAAAPPPAQTPPETAAPPRTPEVPQLAPLPSSLGVSPPPPATELATPPTAASPASPSPTPSAPSAATIRPAPPAPPSPPVPPAAPATPGGRPAAETPRTAAPARPGAAAPAVARTPARISRPGTITLAQQLGLGVRRVVLDPGHGAHDPGAIGVDGLQEKEVTLDLALRLRELLERDGFTAVLTRDRDVFLPLEERTAIANTSNADLFLSLHCNSSERGDLNGVETYFLNLASDRRAMQVAATENSLSSAQIGDLNRLLKEIFNAKMDESSRLAAAIQQSLHGGLRRRHRDVKNLGVKQAPFYVLIGAEMPSVLAEVSFINHKVEGRRLADPRYLQAAAEAIADGVRRYAKAVKVAAAPAPAQKAPAKPAAKGAPKAAATPPPAKRTGRP